MHRHWVDLLSWSISSQVFIIRFVFELPDGCFDGQTGGGSFGDGSPHNINSKAWLG
jgi:hypothetical protein